MALTMEQKERLRESVIMRLADAPAISMTVGELRRRLVRDGAVPPEVDEADVREALAVLEGLGLVRQAPGPLGASIRWSATAEGVLFRERNLP